MIRIRPYVDSDEDRILAWCHDEDTYYNWTAGILGAYPITAEQLRRTAGVMRFTALVGEEAAGFFTARHPNGSPDELRFGFVIVDPNKRGQGVGKGMLRLGLAFAFDIYRARRVTLGVFEDNPPARFCYRAAGFRETGARETYSIRGAERVSIEMEALNPRL